VISVVRPFRNARAALLLAAAVIGSAALLQWWWAGWSAYTGSAPPMGTRWLLTSSLGAALLLPPCAAVWGAAETRRLVDTGWLDQLRITRWSAGRLSMVVAARAVAPVLLALLGSAIGWMGVSLRDPAALLRRTGVVGGIGPLEIGIAHGLAAVIAAAFGLWGAALAAGKRNPASGRWGDWRRLGSWGPAAQVLLSLGPWLVDPVLPHLSRPERVLDAALVVNPVTAVGAALGMDLLRSPRLYDLTRAPEYWYTYPPAALVAAIYGLLACWGAFRLRRRLEAE
jgi:hypothetical protein